MRESSVTLDNGNYQIKGFLDDNPTSLDRFDIEEKVIGDIVNYNIQEDDRFIFAIGLRFAPFRVFHFRSGFISILINLNSIAIKIKCHHHSSIQIKFLSIVSGLECLK